MIAFRSLLIPNLVAALFLLPPGAAAQETRPDTVPPVELEPLSVSVLRVPFPLFMVPFAVSAGRAIGCPFAGSGPERSSAFGE